MDPKLVQIALPKPDRYGRLRFRDLVDTGGPILRFRSGLGFVERARMEREGCTIEPLDDEPGWEERQGWWWLLHSLPKYSLDWHRAP